MPTTTANLLAKNIIELRCHSLESRTFRFLSLLFVIPVVYLICNVFHTHLYRYHQIEWDYLSEEEELLRYEEYHNIIDENYKGP
jgi:hypothetical protein